MEYRSCLSEVTKACGAPQKEVPGGAGWLEASAHERLETSFPWADRASFPGMGDVGLSQKAEEKKPLSCSFVFHLRWECDQRRRLPSRTLPSPIKPLFSVAVSMAVVIPPRQGSTDGRKGIPALSFPEGLSLY